MTMSFIRVKMESRTMSVHQVRRANVLLVDDSDVVVRLLQAAMEDHPLLSLMHIARDGVEALEFLRREGEHQNARFPDLVLLDINMPRMNGFQVLEQMKRDRSLCKIPVIILSTSEDQEDIDKSYMEGANTFVTKPVGFDDLERVLAGFAEYWRNIARLPSSNSVGR
jgi:CheY-like chemotaxis protein